MPPSPSLIFGPFQKAFPKLSRGALNIWDVLGETPTSTAEIIQLAGFGNPVVGKKKRFTETFPQWVDF